MVCPRAAQCATHPAAVIVSLVNASTLSVRPETLSLRHPTAVQPAGTLAVEFEGAEPTGALEADGWAAEEVATLELEVVAERADVVWTAEEEARVEVEEETGMTTLVVVEGLAEEDTDDDVEAAFVTPLVVRSVSLAGPPQISFAGTKPSIFTPWSTGGTSAYRSQRSGCCTGPT